MNTIEHLPFFERLGAVDEHTPGWRRVRAMLVTLRLVDGALQLGTTLDAWNLRAVQTAIDAVPSTDPMRVILQGIAETVSRGERVRSSVLPRLLALGRALELDADWDLATDVYETVEQFAVPAEDGEMAVDAVMRIGFCARTQGRWDMAMDAFLRGGRLAHILGDRSRVLRSQLSQAIVVRQRGNWPLAVRLLDETIEECRALKEWGVCAPALHERATVAFQQRDFERGIVLAHAAFDMHQSATERDRVMIDMASAFLELGIRAAARDAYLIVAATAQESWTRWIATINLMELAYLEGSEPLFEQYRRELPLKQLPPPLLAGFYLVAGRGLHVFGHAEDGNALLRKAVDVSAANSINDVLFQAEESLRTAPRGRAAPDVSATPDALAEIARALRDKRKEAGV